MKKSILLLVLIVFIISGCGKSRLEKTIDKIEEKTEQINEKIQNKMDELDEKLESIKIPNVTGLDLNDAKDRLEKIGFKVNVEHIYDDEVAKGKVIRINPKQETEWNKGGSVTIFISKGSNKIKIEDYVGMDYREAKSKLENKGIIVTIEKTESTDDLVQENTVVKQSIDPDVNVESGSTIKLYIPDIVNKYPDFTNGSYSTSDVQAFCDKYGIVLSIENDSTASNGTITSQSRSAGSAIVHGQTLKITVGTN